MPLSYVGMFNTVLWMTGNHSSVLTEMDVPPFRAPPSPESVLGLTPGVIVFRPFGTDAFGIVTPFWECNF